MKLFKDVAPLEKIFILEPMSFKIHEAEVKRSCVHPQSKNKKVWIMEFYLPFKTDKITVNAMKIAETMGSKTVMQCFLNADHSIMTIAVKPMPTLIATTREEIEKCLRTATPNDLSDYLMLRQGPIVKKRPWH